MELTCNRCHQTVESGASFCPNCGLPQLVYSAEDEAENGQPANWDEAVRDASSVAWRPAMRSALMLAVPAGLAGALLGLPGLLLMAIAGAWTVSLYSRSQRPAWITTGAGARIGLVFGLMAGWLAFAAAGGGLFVQRYALHRGGQIDAQWKQVVELQGQMTQRFASSMGVADTADVQKQQAQNQAWMLSPEGHAEVVTANLVFSSVLFSIFAMLGGALGARLQARRRRPRA